MYENTEVKVKITMGNIPLTIAQDTPQFGFPTQLPDQNNLSNGQFPTISGQSLGFIEPAPVPGFAQPVPPYGSQPFTTPYPQQPTIPAQSTMPYVQPSLYPQIDNQSNLPYPNVNMQQAAFNPAYNNLNSGTTPSAPTAPSF